MRGALCSTIHSLPQNQGLRGDLIVARASGKPRRLSAKQRGRPRSRTRQRVSPETSTLPDQPSEAKESSDSEKKDDVVSRSQSPRSRVKAVAAKISAARELARRLADEKQAAVSQDTERNQRSRRNAAEATRFAAIQAARADAMARAVAKAEKGLAKDLVRRNLEAKTRALQSLVLEFAQDETEARSRLREIDEYFFQDSHESSQDAGEKSVKSEQKTHSVRELEKVSIEESNGVAEADIVTNQPDDLTLKAAAKQAVADSRIFFTFPEAPLVPGRSVMLFYNRLSPVLPGGAELVLKYGTNKWEDTYELKMERKMILDENDSEWWGVEVQLTEDVFRLDFLFEDSVSGFADNNLSLDYQLELKNCLTEEEVLERRLQEIERYDEQRKQEMEQESQKYRKEIAVAMESAAQAAQAKFRAERMAELRKLATDSVVERRARAVKALMNANRSLDNVFNWCSSVQHGKECFLAYNLLHGPLSSSETITLHMGTDDWWNTEKLVASLHKLTPKELEQHGLTNIPGQQEWMGVSVEVPLVAAVLDFVFSDGEEAFWDNNNGADFHTAVEDPLHNNELVVACFESLRSIFSEQDLDLERRIGNAAGNKLKVKAESYLLRHQARCKYLFTKPMTPQAGESVDVFYKPELTSLRGRPEVFVRGSFNRWRHAECFRPTKLVPTIKGGVGFLKTRIQIPRDAHFIDLVFSDSDNVHSGFFDDNGGLDYHLPVAGAEGQVKPLHVIHVTVEMAPIAKVGGLADVVTALGRAVQNEGHKVEVILPKYDVLDYNQISNLEKGRGFHFEGSFVESWRGQVEGLDVTFLEPDNGVFWTGCIYGAKDDPGRFSFFCGAALEYMRSFGISPDIIHCHDWQTAPVVFGNHYRSKTIFTIHNLNYGVDLIAQALESCNVATTVSPTYATEISGNPSVAPNISKLFGIRNGIDVDVWDPSLDKLLPCTYSEENSTEGKSRVKWELQEKMGLEHLDVPIVGVVTRLTPQKGVHLIRHAAWRTLERGGQFVLLGSAPDPAIQEEFDTLAVDLASQYPNRVQLCFEYNEPLSHLIFAGSDIFLVPSMFEPCGLTQMIAMRYGTIPVVRKTGGLSDTVFDIDDDEEKANACGMVTNGFSFEGLDTGGVDYGLNRALTYFYSENEKWASLVKRVMKQDWSWGVPGNDYIDLYYKALK